MTTRAETAEQDDVQASLNAELWAHSDFVAEYATRELRAVEAKLLEDHREALAGRVLELGCGGGRLTGHLCEIAKSVHGLDISPAMVAYCRRTYPQATFSEGDMLDLSGFERAGFDVVVAPFNVLDVFGDRERRQVLEQIRRVLTDDGLAIVSSHNRAYKPSIGPGLRSLIGSPRQPLESIRRLPLRLRNRRRLRPLQRSEDDYAIVNDEAQDFSVLHYYTTRDAQERQFTQHGYELLECLDRDGRPVAAGGAASHCPELHYVARVVQPGV
jgi:SAM-dependent methyltransferase